MAPAGLLASLPKQQKFMQVHPRQAPSMQSVRIIQGSTRGCWATACAVGRVSPTHSTVGQYQHSGHSRQHSKHTMRAYEEGGSSSKDPSLEDYVEVRIESVRMSKEASVVYLRVVGSDAVVPVHIGENESNALLREINKHRQVRAPWSWTISGSLFVRFFKRV